MSILLKVNDLAVAFDTEQGRLQAVDSFSFELSRGETMGIVGESGCGKSVSSLAMMRLLPKPAGHITSGEVILEGQDILKMSIKQVHKIRGKRMAMIFQEPMTALNPVKKVGKQIKEVFELHAPEYNENERHKKAIELLERVGVPAPDKRMHEYPHQLSGGMRQRVVIAIALACKPDVLIADEPTTALDVTIQAQILNLIKELQDETGMGIIFITHDLGVIAQICDSMLVMYAGRVVEEGPVDQAFIHSRHPYTKMLLDSIPTLDHPPKCELKTIPGRVPGLYEMPKGCRFSNRCPLSTERCEQESPVFEVVGTDHRVQCFEWQKMQDKG